MGDATELNSCDAARLRNGTVLRPPSSREAIARADSHSFGMSLTNTSNKDQSQSEDDGNEKSPYLTEMHATNAKVAPGEC